MSKVMCVAAVAVVAAMAGCSGGGAGTKQAASPTTTSTAPTTTSVASSTSTTLSQEDQVKAAWDGYWTMVVRLAGHPDPNDPELAVRAANPLLASLRDDFSTREAAGERVVVPPSTQYQHQFLSASITAYTAKVSGCQLDDSVTVGPSGEVLDDTVSTKDITATFIREGSNWLANDVQIVERAKGLVGCAS
jgi:hypothetical protein